MRIVDDISLKITDENVEKKGHEIRNLRVANLQMLSLEKLYQKEAVMRTEFLKQ